MLLSTQGVQMKDEELMRETRVGQVWMWLDRNAYDSEVEAETHVIIGCHLRHGIPWCQVLITMPDGRIWRFAERTSYYDSPSVYMTRVL